MDRGLEHTLSITMDELLRGSTEPWPRYHSGNRESHLPTRRVSEGTPAEPSLTRRVGIGQHPKHPGRVNGKMKRCCESDKTKPILVSTQVIFQKGFDHENTALALRERSQSAEGRWVARQAGDAEVGANRACAGADNLDSRGWTKVSGCRVQGRFEFQGKARATRS